MKNSKYTLSAQLEQCENTKFWLQTLKSDQTYSLCSEGYHKKNFNTICPLIVEWNLQKQFVAYGSYATNILKDIQHIKFNRLKSLNLWGNNIQSIQPICRMEMPMVEQLWIWSNNISSIRPLRRVNFPHLKTLDIKQNKIVEHESLSQLRMVQRILHRIDIGSNSDKEKQKFCINWLIKLEVKKINQINLSNNFNSIIVNQKIRAMKRSQPEDQQQIQLLSKSGENQEEGQEQQHMG